MLNKNDLDRLWLLLSDLQDSLPEEGSAAMLWGNINTVMEYVDYLSRNLEEQQQQHEEDK